MWLCIPKTFLRPFLVQKWWLTYLTWLQRPAWSCPWQAVYSPLTLYSLLLALLQPHRVLCATKKHGLHALLSTLNMLPFVCVLNIFSFQISIKAPLYHGFQFLPSWCYTLSFVVLISICDYVLICTIIWLISDSYKHHKIRGCVVLVYHFLSVSSKVQIKMP